MNKETKFCLHVQLYFPFYAIIFNSMKLDINFEIVPLNFAVTPVSDVIRVRTGKHYRVGIL